MSNMHPTAVVHETAKIDPSAKVGPFAVIGEDVVIGADCEIGAHAIVEFTHMGSGNKIHPHAFVGTPPQDLKYKGERSLLLLGDKNTVRECVTLNRGTAATGETRIGSGCLFMTCAHVGHDCRVGNGVILVNACALAGHVEIGDHAVLSASVMVHQFARVGRLAMVSGNTGVGKDVPPFCTAQGFRATLRGLNSLGLRRGGISPASARAIKEAYKTLFLSGMTVEEACAKLKGSAPTAEVLELVSFIASAKRGITRPATGVESEEEVAA
ncbi:MAG: acyl-ACP--UDP-N-acetylglucosamine O-acyltransferase [Elusimicrobiota bacterium]